MLLKCGLVSIKTDHELLRMIKIKSIQKNTQTHTNGDIYKKKQKQMVNIT